MDRRAFIKEGALIVAGLASLKISKAYSFNGEYKGLYILQGASCENKVQICVLHSKTESYQFYALDNNGKKIAPADIRTIATSYNDDMLVHLYFDQLIAQDYKLVVKSSLDQIVDERIFSPLEKKHNYSMTFSSCMDQNMHKENIWRALGAKKPDILFLTGDAVYADKPPSGEKISADPRQLWETFCLSRRTLELYRLPRLIPTYAIWDDHDFGANNSGKEFPYIEESQINFHQFFPQDSHFCHNLESGPGISKKLSLGKQNFFLMDSRSFREAKGSENSYAHWGQEQHKWCMSRFEEAPFNWLINGNQFFTSHSLKETFAGNHPNHLKKLLQDMQIMSSKAIFVSGDVHYSELARIEKELLGYETLEITSSSMHSFRINGIDQFFKHPRRIPGKSTSTHNFNYVQTTSKDQELLVDIECINESGFLMYKHSHKLGDQIYLMDEYFA